jgi:hypothetical protein
LYPVEEEKAARRYLYGHGRILQDGFQEKGSTKYPTFESCQHPSSVLMDSSYNSTKNANKEQMTVTKHIPQNTSSSWSWPLLFGHFNKQTIKVVNMSSSACFWQLEGDFMYKYLSLQDIKLKFEKLKNVKVYLSSYFKINDSRPSKSEYYLDEKEVEQLLQREPFTFEMYNKTFVYIVPMDATLPTEAEFSFWVFQAQ